ncbi:MAG TPA: DNA internalization-related competence protein ComEC/Rec2 [Firmicutes bacterium]|nr:DNA internalization-related competence protein ComEC/Rec2 [Bacillota bacterium]
MTKISNFFILFPLLALGILYGSRSHVSPHLFIWLLLLIPLWLWLEYKGRKAAGLVYWAVLTGAITALGCLAAAPQAADWPKDPQKLTAVVKSVQTLSSDQRVLVTTIPQKLGLALHLPLDVPVSAGDYIEFKGTITTPPSAPNPGMFSYRDYLNQLGVWGLCYPVEFTIQKRVQRSVLARLREWCLQNINRDLDDPGLVSALVLGDRAGLSQERREIWRLLGINHLLAISGMHVGLAALFFALFLKRLPLRPLFRLLLTQVFLLAYILLAGNSASAWRAFAAFALGGLGNHRRLLLNPLHIWSLVGFTLLVAQPQLLFQKAFTLSFVASGGILLWMPVLRCQKGGAFWRYLINSMAVSVIAQLSLAPLLLHYFAEIAVLGPLATLVFLPFTAVILAGGFLAALGLGPWGVAQLLNAVIRCVTILENSLVPYALQWQPQYLSQGEILLWWAFFIYAGWRLRRPRLTVPKNTYRRLLYLFLLICLISGLPAFIRRPLEVTALNVGQGDCFFIRTPGGLNLLVDGGGDSPYWQARGRNVGRERVLPYLRRRGVAKLDAVILSHPHEDHLFGLLAVLEELEVAVVIDNGQAHPTPTYERYLDLISAKNIPHVAARRGERLVLERGISLEILHPGRLLAGTDSDANNNSLVFQLAYGRVKMLFTGDIELPVLYDLVAIQGEHLESKWLKVPHHGSRSSFYPEFYDAVDPAFAVIPAGEGNLFGHPHPEVTSLFNQKGIRWSTPGAGPVRFFVWWGFFSRFLSAAH